MSDISRVALFGKLNSLGYKAVEGATVFCKLRGNPYVELVHWFHQILQLQNSDLHSIVRAFNLDAARVAREMTDALDRLPRGATSKRGLLRSTPVAEGVKTIDGWATGGRGGDIGVVCSGGTRTTARAGPPPNWEMRSLRALARPRWRSWPSRAGTPPVPKPP